MPRSGVASILGFVPPEFHHNKVGAYIDFSVVNPKTGKLERKRIKLNRVPKPLLKQTARVAVAELYDKLRRGWNPFNETAEEFRMGITVTEALDLWDRVKVRQLRHSSPYSYTSMTNMLRAWVADNKLGAIGIHQFNRSHATEFLTYVSDVRLVGNRTYNNYLTFFRMMFKWFIERNHRKDNPFEGFAKRKKPNKTRTYLTEEDRVMMAEWIRANDPVFWMPCMFIYGTLIRPGELARLRVHHVDLNAQVVILPAEVTKNGMERIAAIPNWMADELRAMEFHKQPGKAWLLGSRILPSEKPIARNTLNRRWNKLRSALNWPDTKELYSLRDTGIIQLLRDGVDILHVRDQAGHQDIATTNIYLRHAFPNGPAEVRSRSTPLQASSPFTIGAPLYPPEPLDQ